jgi:hypothetical protein
VTSHLLVLSGAHRGEATSYRRRDGSVSATLVDSTAEFAVRRLQIVLVCFASSAHRRPNERGGQVRFRVSMMGFRFLRASVGGRGLRSTP